jgi:hypothetical protein
MTISNRHQGGVSRVLVVVGTVIGGLIVGVFGLIIFQATRAAEPCPLCESIASEDVATVERALAGGAGVTDRAWRAALERVDSPQDSDGSPLQIVARLIEHGADPNFAWTTFEQSTGASVGEARTGRSSNLGPRSSETSRRMFAAAAVAADTDDVATMNALLAKGLDVKGQGAGEALIVAAALEHLKTVRRLLEAGVPVNYVASQAPRRTPLAEAIQTRNLAVIGALEAAGGREW